MNVKRNFKIKFLNSMGQKPTKCFKKCPCRRTSAMKSSMKKTRKTSMVMNLIKNNSVSEKALVNMVRELLIQFR